MKFFLCAHPVPLYQVSDKICFPWSCSCSALSRSAAFTLLMGQTLWGCFKNSIWGRHSRAPHGWRLCMGARESMPEREPPLIALLPARGAGGVETPWSHLPGAQFGQVLCVLGVLITLRLHTRILQISVKIFLFSFSPASPY